MKLAPILALSLIACSPVPTITAEDIGTAQQGISPPPHVYECHLEGVVTMGGPFHSWVEPTCSGDFGHPLFGGSKYVFSMTTEKLYQAQEEVESVYVRVPPPNGNCTKLEGPGPHYRWVPVEVEQVEGVISK